jgi:hypothetical protein
VFSQIAIILLALFGIALGIREGDYFFVGTAVLIGVFAAKTLYQLKTGK